MCIGLRSLSCRLFDFFSIFGAFSFFIVLLVAFFVVDLLHPYPSELLNFLLQLPILLIFIVVPLHSIIVFIIDLRFVLEIGPLRLQMLPFVLEIEGEAADGLTDLLSVDVFGEHLVDYLVFYVGWLHIQLVQALEDTLLKVHIRVDFLG